jgi:hypothetical protein
VEGKKLKMTIKFFDEILKEIEEQGFASFPPNCVNGEEYEDWLRENKIKNEEGQLRKE